jgi:hypothetical protein
LLSLALSILLLRSSDGNGRLHKEMAMGCGNKSVYAAADTE